MVTIHSEAQCLFLEYRIVVIFKILFLSSIFLKLILLSLRFKTEYPVLFNLTKSIIFKHAFQFHPPKLTTKILHFYHQISIIFVSHFIVVEYKWLSLYQIRIIKFLENFRCLISYYYCFHKKIIIFKIFFLLSLF